MMRSVMTVIALLLIGASIGLHPKDTEKLINILIDLKNIGNTVLVVEHDEDIMKSADRIIRS